jgi:RNase P subunit RPR2
MYNNSFCTVNALVICKICRRPLVTVSNDVTVTTDVHRLCNGNEVIITCRSNVAYLGC